jgi:hypothetical protein
MGLPALMVSVAENQIAIARELHRIGAGIYLGPDSKNDAASLSRAVESLVSRPGDIHDLSAAAMRLVDGLGTRRVALALGSPT